MPMLKRLVTCAAVAATASLALAGTANAAFVTFDDIAFSPDPILGSYGGLPTVNNFADQGLNLYSGQAFVIPKELSPDPTVFPTAFSSNFWETYGEDVIITRAGPPGGLFDLQSFSLGLGVGLDGEPTTDTVHVSWIRGGGCAIGCSGGEDLDLGLGFQTYSFTGLTDLASFTLGTTNVVRFTALDDINFSVGVVPEPAAWTLMIAGFAGLGAMLRRRRHAALTA
jgi:hypothetical protein